MLFLIHLTSAGLVSSTSKVTVSLSSTVLGSSFFLNEIEASAKGEKNISKNVEDPENKFWERIKVVAHVSPVPMRVSVFNEAKAEFPCC